MGTLFHTRLIFTDRFYYFDEFDLGDLDNDGDLDLLTEIEDQYIQIWRNDGRGYLAVIIINLIIMPLPCSGLLSWVI